MRAFKAVVLCVIVCLAAASTWAAFRGARSQAVAEIEWGVAGTGAADETRAVPADLRAASGAEAGAETPEEDPGLWVEVDQARQRVFIHQDGKIVRTLVASTGVADSPTPNGTFTIENRGEWFYSGKHKQGGKYWVSFLNRGEYLFHSVPMDENRKVFPEEADKLGRKASHGCVRLPVADAKWVYENIPAGTRVIIHD